MCRHEHRPSRGLKHFLCSSLCPTLMSKKAMCPNNSGSSFVDQIERCFSCAAKASEPRRVHDLSHPLLAGLSPKTQGHFLRAGTGRTQQCRKRIVDSANRIQVVLKVVIRERLNNHPRSVVLNRTPDMRGSAHRIAHVMQAIEDRNEVVIASGKFLRSGDLECDAIRHTCLLRRSSCQFDGFIVVVKSVEL